MKNTLFRRVAVGTFATVAAVGLSTLFADAASAHNANPSGVADCRDGKYVITWTVENDFGTKVTLSNIHITPDGGKHGDIVLGGKGSRDDEPSKQTFTTEYTTDKATDLQLSVDGLWQDAPHKTWPEDGKPHTFVSGKVHLDGKCKADTPPTTPPPTTPPATTPPATRTPTPAASSPAPGLPVTGSDTTWPMVGTGAALVASGAVLVVTLRRRRRVTFTAE
ncbi:LPXTG cell wall anchor domain-containing protein [Dactylosporangium sp. NPDC051485]|uniref:LPXTG cell wall anchor domain-containing protein n=1 Tax=Dactylosporangium sp. NPDC051485 TaxID=3154846 RepID=UPI0034201CC3